MIARRTVLQTMGAGVAALGMGAVPALSRPGQRPAHHLPPALAPGSVVGLVEPAGFTEGPERIAQVRHTIEGMGLVPRTGRHVGDHFGYLAGNDADRAADLNAMYADPEVRAVFAVRGGWGCARILPLLDWKTIRANPKLLIGFSDITALHLAFAARAGFPTLHGPNASSSWPVAAWEPFWRMAFSAQAPLIDLKRENEPVTTLHPGTASGPLLGGNLSVMSALVGTPWLPDFTGAILFIEEVGEDPYRVDRMLSQMQLSGILGKAAGVIFGQCTRCESRDGTPSGFSAAEVIAQYLVPLGVPALSGANVGHVYGQTVLPSGARVELDADAGTVRLLSPIVA